jgi:hypothetical protein
MIVSKWSFLTVQIRNLIWFVILHFQCGRFLSLLFRFFIVRRLGLIRGVYWGHVWPHIGCNSCAILLSSFCALSRNSFEVSGVLRHPRFRKRWARYVGLLSTPICNANMTPLMGLPITARDIERLIRTSWCLHIVSYVDFHPHFSSFNMQKRTKKRPLLVLMMILIFTVSSKQELNCCMKIPTFFKTTPILCRSFEWLQLSVSPKF